MHAFLSGRLPFLGIAAVIEETLSRLDVRQLHSFETLTGADAEAREVAASLIEDRAAA